MKCQPSVVGQWDVLVVDADPGTAELVRSAARDQGAATGFTVRAAASADHALAALHQRPADVVFVSLHIHDNGGLDLLKQVRKTYPGAEVIALSRVRRTTVCVDAFRAGAADLLFGVEADGGREELSRALAAVADRRAAAARMAGRTARLRRVCKQLNKARHEIRQQVDLLCNDLVRAYQDMAAQLNTAQIGADFAAALAPELEVEGLLRKSMEWFLRKLGPVNAAVYLPDGDRQFALGAYLNLDTEADAPLIATLGETLVHQADKASGPVVAENDAAIDGLFGLEGERLKGRAWVALACLPQGGDGHGGAAPMAVLVVFKKQSPGGTDIDPHMLAILEATAPVMGERIQQALGLYHRLHPFLEDDSSDYESA